MAITFGMLTYADRIFKRVGRMGASAFSRIMGLILAALIVGAAMLMRIETSWTILGYPGLAILFFLAAAGGGLWLLFDILLADRQTRRAARSKALK